MSVAAIAGAAITAGGAYMASRSANKGSGGGPAQSDPGQDVLSYVHGMQRALPALYGSEAHYRPMFGQLNIGDQQQYLNALFGMSGQAQGSAQQMLQNARQGDISSLMGGAGGARDALAAVNPAGAQIADRSAQFATDRYNASQGLNMQEARRSDQTAREGFADRGRLNDNASVASEILGREEVLADKRAESQAAQQQAFLMNQDFSSPIFQLLTGTPGSIGLGQGLVGASAGAIGANTPQLLNPDAGINIGMANAANQQSYNNAMMANRASSGAAWGQAASALGNAVTAGIQNYQTRP